MNNIFFTADTHFRHANIIKYCNRPFASAEEMDETMIANWNSVVAPQDTVWHLGDFAFCRTTEEIEPILKRLNGKIHLIWGNHDYTQTKRATGFAWQGQYREIKIGNQSITLFHYPMLSWNKSHHGAWQLHGHVHNTLPKSDIFRVDVGMDAQNFHPITFEQVRGWGRTMSAGKKIDELFTEFVERHNKGEQFVIDEFVTRGGPGGEPLRLMIESFLDAQSGERALVERITERVMRAVSKQRPVTLEVGEKKETIA